MINYCDFLNCFVYDSSHGEVDIISVCLLSEILIQSLIRDHATQEQLRHCVDQKRWVVRISSKELPNREEVLHWGLYFHQHLRRSRI